MDDGRRPRRHAHQSLPPEPQTEGKIAVSLWLARDPRIALAAPQAGAKEVA